MLQRSRRLTLAHLPVTGLLLLNAVLLGIYRSERLPVIVALLLSYLATVSYGQRIRLTSLARVVIVVLLSFQLLTSARSGGASVETASVAGQVVESLVENRNLIDPSKTAHIIDGIPDLVGFADGSTIYSYALAPVPRSVWPQKPIIAPGPELGIKIFGTNRAGIPPGLFAEMYWNFWWVGIAVGVPLAGAAFGLLERRMRVMVDQNGLPKVFALVVLSQVPANALGIAVGQALLSAAIDVVIIFVMYRLFGGIQRRTPSRES